MTRASLPPPGVSCLMYHEGRVLRFGALVSPDDLVGGFAVVAEFDALRGGWLVSVGVVGFSIVSELAKG